MIFHRTHRLASLAIAGTLLAASPAFAQHDDIVETATKAGSFKTLAAALGAADLVDTLRGKGPFTVLAPTDEAFAKLPKETLGLLLEPQNKDLLTSILTYHVVPGRVGAVAALGAGTAKTVQGARVAFKIDGGQLTAGGARVVANDIAASNGVIHVIDTVLMPPDMPKPKVKPSGPLVIGLYTNSASSARRAEVGLGEGEGRVISRISKTGGARDAGLQDGDLIVTVNGMPATSANISRAKAEAGDGGFIEIVFARRVKVEVRADH